MSLCVPPFRVQELLQELSLWSQRLRQTKKQLQSLLGKLSFVTQAAQTHYMTLACERCCVTNGYLQRLVWDVNGFS